MRVLRGGRQLGRALPRHLGPGLLRRRAGPALDRLPARLRGQPPLLRLLHRHRGRHPGRRVQAQKRDASRAGLPSRSDRDTPPGQLQSQRRPAAVPRRPPLLRHRRRRLRRRPAEQRPEPRQPARQAAADRPPPAAPYSAAATRSSAPAREIYSYGLRNPFRFSFDTVSAAQPRIVDRRRRPEPLRGDRLHDRGRGAGRQLRLGRLRGLRPLPRRKQRHSRPWRNGEADLRLPAQPRRQLHGHRRLRGRRPRACRPSTGAMSTPTSARASCAASSPTWAGQRATASSASASPPPAPSAKTPTAASTSPRSKGRSTASFRR